MKLDRLLGMLTVLLQRDGVTAPQLAARFEVSRRTVSRDIDALCQAGIPIVTRQGGGGGIAIAEGYKLDRSVLTTDELASLIAALKGLGTVSEAPRMQRLLDKFSAGSDAVVSLREPIVIDLATYYKGDLSEKIPCLRRAIGEQRVVAFDYHSAKGVSRRRVEPALIVFRWEAWYLFGYCREREDWRMFKLGRMLDLAVEEEGFAPREIELDRMDFDAHLPDDRPLVALFQPAARYRLIEDYGTQSFTELADGRLRLSIGYTNRDFILRWLLGFGDQAQVLEPAALAEEIRRIAQNLLAQST